MRAAAPALMIAPSLTTYLSVMGSTMLWAATRPMMASESGRSISAPRYHVSFSMELSVPQSSSLTMTFWATSASLRVRYPESAVLRAVSARPLRAPWVEEKYSSTERPSRKLALMGVSMMRPEGLAIRPRIPANCRTWSMLPRAPECVIRKMGLTYALPPRVSCSSSRIISWVTSSRAWVQASTTWL